MSVGTQSKRDSLTERNIDRTRSSGYPQQIPEYIVREGIGRACNVMITPGRKRRCQGASTDIQRAHALANIREEGRAQEQAGTRRRTRIAGRGGQGRAELPNPAVSG